MEQQVSGNIRFGRLAPTVPVSEIAPSIEFYTSILGFRKVFENGSPLRFAILTKDAAELHLTLNKGHKGSTLNVCHLMVEDAAVLYDHLTRNDVNIVKAIRDADFGLRCFVFADPDGNRIDVGQNL